MYCTLCHGSPLDIIIKREGGKKAHLKQDKHYNKALLKTFFWDHFNQSDSAQTGSQSHLK